MVVEDDVELAAHLNSILVAAGYEVDHAADGEEAWWRGGAQTYDGCVLDLGLPQMSGLDVLKKWRTAGIDFPVVILSARNSWNERVAGLNLGADDYLGKPFQPQELLARLNAQIRRARPSESPALQLGRYSLDWETGVASSPDGAMTLTGTELRVLRYLSQRAGHIVSQSELMDHVYSDGENAESNTIEVYVGRLRRKFGKDVVRTVRGLGYILG